mgnify:CR=1 FL=1
MRKQKIPITALSMPENIPGIEYKWLRNRSVSYTHLTLPTT